jgi:MoaA/NifB/PqqE/SkfB family radical SAM enzyme
VTPNKNIFCNTPWYEIHIYWDGSLGICCQESDKLYDPAEKKYNIATMSIMDWFNSDPVKQFRTRMLGSSRIKQCTRCYIEEDHGGNSRRLKSNQKSVIFNRTAFEHSIQQSPGYKHFLFSSEQQGQTNTHPIDMHIDLGNFCNLACKMCGPRASSTIAVQQVKWGIETSRQYLGNDWTRDSTVWENFKQQILQIPNLNNIHFMGGETLLTDRLEDLVDTMIAHERFDLCFSFVTNGTVFNERLLKKLQKFRRVGLEISIETVDEHNAYQRQGTNTDLVLSNIDKYLTWCDQTSVTVALRPAPSLLTIGYYHNLLQYALNRQLIVKSNLCYSPRFLSAEILPADIKALYKTNYEKLLEQLQSVDVDNDFNASDPHNFSAVIKEHALMCLSILESPTPDDSETQLEAMVRHCERWDQVYGYDARKLYPEFANILNRYGYTTPS